MPEKKERSKAQASADGRYEKKRAGMARLPGGYLNEEEADLLDAMAEVCGSKKAAIFRGLELLKESLENNQE